MTRWSGSPRRRSKTPVPWRGAARRAGGPGGGWGRIRGAAGARAPAGCGCERRGAPSGGGGHQTGLPVGELAGGAQPCGLRARVLGDLAGRGRDGAAEDALGLGRAPAAADGQVGRADAAARAVGEEALDAAVLERVEGDRGQPALGAQELPRQRQRGVELLELAVDRDADRLEGALGRVAAAEARGRGDRRGDGVDELEGGGERAELAAADDLARDPLGVALLAVLAQRARDLAALPRVDDLGGGQRLRRDPSACRAARRTRRRTRARACRPASRTSRGRGRRDRPRSPRRAASRGRPRSRRAGSACGRTPRRRARRRPPRPAGRGRCPRAGRRARGGRPRGGRGRPRRRVQSTATWPSCGSSASISSPARTGTWVRGMSSRMAKSSGELRRARREVGLVGGPGVQIPELERVARAHDHHLAVDAGEARDAPAAASRGPRSRAPRRPRCRAGRAASRAPRATSG